MKKSNIIFLIAMLICVVSCREEELNKESIFKDPSGEQVDQYTKDFDAWLQEAFVKPYNCEFIYRLNDASMDPNYNVVPVSIGKADTMAHIALYLWYNVYDTVMRRTGDTAFLSTNGPRKIQLVGSSMINAAAGTEKLGYAEGGIQITLMKINKMNWNDMDLLNEYIFKTMHHEFGHILHQKKTYPREFETITPGDYDPIKWQEMPDEEAWTRGFVSNYAHCEYHEDFVETIANYIVKDDKTWAKILNKAGEKGATCILAKLEIARKWLKDQWNIDIDQMHEEVQVRQQHMDYEQIMQCNFDWKTYPVK